MSKSKLKLHSYENLLKTLVHLLQSQVLSMARLHGIDRPWSSQLTSILSHMQEFEVKQPQTPSYSFVCKDLYNYLSRRLASQQSSRSRAATVESSFKKRTQSSQPGTPLASTLAPSGLQVRPPGTSAYYSKIMNKFLSTQHNTPKFESRIRLKKGQTEDQDIWVLGDEIKFLV